MSRRVQARRDDAQSSLSECSRVPHGGDSTGSRCDSLHAQPVCCRPMTNTLAGAQACVSVPAGNPNARTRVRQLLAITAIVIAISRATLTRTGRAASALGAAQVAMFFHLTTVVSAFATRNSDQSRCRRPKPSTWRCRKRRRKPFGSSRSRVNSMNSVQKTRFWSTEIAKARSRWPRTRNSTSAPSTSISDITSCAKRSNLATLSYSTVRRPTCSQTS